MFKSETGKDPITEFVGLCTKMYSFITESDQQAHMCAKGVGKKALETLKHSDYIQCLANGTSNIIKMQSICSINQQLYTMEMFKKAWAAMMSSGGSVRMASTLSPMATHQENQLLY